MQGLLYLVFLNKVCVIFVVSSERINVSQNIVAESRRHWIKINRQYKGIP